MNELNNHIISGIYTIIDTSVIPINEAEEAAQMILKGGGRLIQLRAKGLPPMDILDVAKKLKKTISICGGTFLINDRLDIAILAKADGVHLGQNDIPCRTAREIADKNFIIGISTHNKTEAVAAQKDGADYIGFGPIFPTTTKSDTEAPKGIEQLKRLIDKIDIPTVAIGGINEKKLEDVLDTRVSSVAMVSDILNSKNISAKVRKLVSIVDSKGRQTREVRSKN